MYLHGTWVWTALGAFLGAAGVGALAFVRWPALHSWSRALGRTGLFFWITYLPISLWAMQTNWNGLFLAEPRWRVAWVFALGGLGLQAGVTLLEHPRWASAANILYTGGLFWALSRTAQVLHPRSPIRDAESARFQVFFGGLMVLTALAGVQVARWWHVRERA